MEQRGPAVCTGSNNKEGKGEMTKTPSSLQDLRRSPIRQGEGGTNLAFLGTIHPGLQEGDTAGGLPVSKSSLIARRSTNRNKRGPRPLRLFLAPGTVVDLTCRVF